MQVYGAIKYSGLRIYCNTKVSDTSNAKKYNIRNLSGFILFFHLTKKLIVSALWSGVFETKTGASSF